MRSVAIRKIGASSTLADIIVLLACGELQWREF